MKRNYTLLQQMKRVVNKKERKEKELFVSTGSTLLDLAISGKRQRGGGLLVGILVEIFGPSGSGKTVLLSEIAGAVQRTGGEVMFQDPEARLNKQFAQLFDFDVGAVDYNTPDTVTDVFNSIREWEPDPDNKVNGVFADSLAALSTDMEMEDGDKMGMRRAKEFSEELRKIARILVNRRILMVASNQIRENAGATYGPKYRTPGGKAVEFYSSVRLKMNVIEKIKKKIKVGKKILEKIVGVITEIEVVKNSVDAPYRKAKVVIVFDYGVDDIRANLQFVKDMTGASSYAIDEDTPLGTSMVKAIQKVEDNNLEEQLRERVIDIWEEIEEKASSKRVKKRR